MTWELKADEGLAYVLAVGSIDLRSVVESIVNVTGSPDFLPHYHVLVDLREMEYTPSVRELMEISSATTSLRSLHDGRVALVTSNAVHYRMTQLSVRLVSVMGVPMKAFRDPDAARSWLLSGEE
jgi:hypothetical protein